MFSTKKDNWPDMIYIGSTERLGKKYNYSIYIYIYIYIYICVCVCVCVCVFKSKRYAKNIKLSKHISKHEERDSNVLY